MSTTEEAGGLQQQRRRAVFSRAAAEVARAAAAPLLKRDQPPVFDHTLPDSDKGMRLLVALTKKMEEDSRTEADVARVAAGLPDDFKKRLNQYFRKSSELLRHFFGLRDMMESGGGSETGGDTGGASHKRDDEQKLARIVKGMEGVYREMEEMRKELPQTESGEVMRKMCLPVMDQLDWAFKIHRDGSGGGGGGFVTVEEIG